MSDDNADESPVLFPIPDDYTLLEWVASLKCLNGDGEVVLVNVASEDLTGWERLGMCESLRMDAKARMCESYIYEDEDED